MPPLTQQLLSHLAAAGTDLRGVFGIHSYDGATGSFSLVVQHSLEHPQPGVVGRQCQVSVLGDKPQGQILDRDQRIGLGQAVGYLVPKVFALISYLFIQSCHPLGLLAAVRASLSLTSQRALGASESCQRRAQPTGVVKARAVRTGQKGHQAFIDPYGLPRAQRRGLHSIVARKTDQPAPACLAGQGNVFQASFGDRPVKTDAHLADVLDVKLIPFELAPVAMPVFHRAEPRSRFEAWKAGLIVVSNATKERDKRLVEASKQLLSGCGIQQPEVFKTGLAILPKAVPLIGVGHRLLGMLIHVSTVCQRLVVQQARLAQNRFQGRRLGRVGVEAILIRALHYDSLSLPSSRVKTVSSCTFGVGIDRSDYARRGYKRPTQRKGLAGPELAGFCVFWVIALFRKRYVLAYRPVKERRLGLQITYIG